MVKEKIEVTKENAGVLVLDHRIEAKITQESMSEKSGVSVQTLRFVESESKTPQTLTIRKLQKYFDSLG